jgi:antirestriction protein
MTYSEAKACLKDTDKDTLKDLIEKFGEELVNQYKKDGYGLDDMDEAYQGEYKNDEDFVQQLLEDCGDMPKDLPAYIHIDWESTARDIMMDYFEIDGHYFR